MKGFSFEFVVLNILPENPKLNSVPPTPPNLVGKYPAHRTETHFHWPLSFSFSVDKLNDFRNKVIEGYLFYEAYRKFSKLTMDNAETKLFSKYRQILSI